MKILLSWSSGKDSAWALHELRRRHPGAVAGLLTTINEANGRVAMHGVRREILEAQAAAAGLPLIVVPIPSPCSNDEYESRMAVVVRRATHEGYTHAAFGDLFLEDVRRYREERLAGTGLVPLFPLWGRDTAALAREMIDAGLQATVTCVDSRALDRSHAGRTFDAAMLASLPPNIDPCGERGEFHTCVIAGPMFGRGIATAVGEIVKREGFVFADLLLNAPAAEARRDEGTKRTKERRRNP